MKKIAWLAILALTPTLAHAWPWSRDMANQISIKPQEKPMPFPKHSVPVAGTQTLRVADRDAAGKLTNPIPATADSVAKGKQLFMIYCTPCHGVSGTGDGLVGEKLVLRPFDLTSDRLKGLPDGYIFGYMTFGGAVMPAYANDLSPTERWHLINYIRNGLNKPAAATQAGNPAK